MQKTSLLAFWNKSSLKQKPLREELKYSWGKLVKIPQTFLKKLPSSYFPRTFKASAYFSWNSYRFQCLNREALLQKNCVLFAINFSISVYSCLFFLFRKIVKGELLYFGLSGENEKKLLRFLTLCWNKEICVIKFY